MRKKWQPDQQSTGSNGHTQRDTFLIVRLPDLDSRFSSFENKGEENVWDMGDGKKSKYQAIQKMQIALIKRAWLSLAPHCP